MKHIHFPTLAMHAGILLLAERTLSDYPGTFLPVGVLALIVHAVWACKSKRLLGPSHLLGAALELAVFSLGLIRFRTGGLSGGEFALFFYEIALAVSVGVETILWLFKRK